MSKIEVEDYTQPVNFDALVKSLGSVIMERAGQIGYASGMYDDEILTALFLACDSMSQYMIEIGGLTEERIVELKARGEEFSHEILETMRKNGSMDRAKQYVKDFKEAREKSAQ